MYFPHGQQLAVFHRSHSPRVAVAPFKAQRMKTNMKALHDTTERKLLHYLKKPHFQSKTEKIKLVLHILLLPDHSFGVITGQQTETTQKTPSGIEEEQEEASCQSRWTATACGVLRLNLRECWQRERVTRRSPGTMSLPGTDLHKRCPSLFQMMDRHGELMRPAAKGQQLQHIYASEISEKSELLGQMRKH